MHKHVPTVVLLKANLTAKQVSDLREAGVEWREDPPKGGPDNGVLVFGKGGQTGVDGKRLLCHLGGEFGVKNVHLVRRQGKSTVLEVVFDRQQVENNLTRQVAAILESVFNKTWIVHVWDNPPQADGVIVHTINCVKWTQGEPPTNNLQYTSQEWKVEAA